MSLRHLLGNRQRMTNDDLTAKGFYQQPDGSWSKRPPVGGLAPKAQQPERPRSLDSQKPRREKRKGRVAVFVSIIACRARETNEDNFIAGTKWLKDSIANTLGLDDADKRIRWEYGQCETRGEQGVIVKVTKQDACQSG